MSGAKAGLSIRSQPGFDTNDLDRWLAQFERHSQSTDQTSSSDGSQDRFNLWKLLQDFEAGCPLTGNNFFIVVRGHDRVTVLGRQFFCAQAAFFTAWSDLDDLRT